MDIELIITGLISAIGGILTTFFGFRINNRKQQTSEIQELMDRYKSMVDKLEAKVEKLSDDLDILRKDKEEQNLIIQNLKNQLLIFESSHVDIPLPMWMKDVEGKMIFINSFYEAQFLLPRGFTIKDYIGSTDYAIWPKEIADQFNSNDKRIMLTKKHIRSIETLIDIDGKEYYGDVLKYPRLLNRSIIGISGIILRTSYNKEELL